MSSYDEMLASFASANNRYVLLSSDVFTNDACGFPYTAKDPEDQSFITVFSDKKIAQAYCKRFGYMNAGRVPLAKLPADNAELATLLIGCMNNSVERVAVVVREDGGVSCDILNFIQNLGCKLDIGMLQYTIPPLELDREFAVAVRSGS